MAATFVPGPKQERWLRALESGRYKQCRSKLFNGEGYCCLGLACALFIPETLSPCPDGSWSFGVDKVVGVLPKEVRNALGFRDAVGGDGYAGVPTCAFMNDTQKLTFPEIAAKIRANPHRYFTHAC